MFPVPHFTIPWRSRCVLAHPQSRAVLRLIAVCIAFLASSFAQQPFSTSRTNNARDGANTQETLLAPANVNQAGFGRLFSFPIDYIAMAQPL